MRLLRGLRHSDEPRLPSIFALRTPSLRVAENAEGGGEDDSWGERCEDRFVELAPLLNRSCVRDEVGKTDPSRPLGGRGSGDTDGEDLLLSPPVILARNLYSRAAVRSLPRQREGLVGTVPRRCYVLTGASGVCVSLLEFSGFWISIYESVLIER